MTLNGIKVDDIVRCDVRGWKFNAIVTKDAHRDETRGRGLKVRSISEKVRIPTEFVTARQVIGHWRKKTGSVVDF